MQNNTVQVRLSNDMNYTTLHNFQWCDFTNQKEYTDEIFGYYKGTYIAVKKQPNP